MQVRTIVRAQIRGPPPKSASGRRDCPHSTGILPVDVLEAQGGHRAERDDPERSNHGRPGRKRPRDARG